MQGGSGGAPAHPVIGSTDCCLEMGPLSRYMGKVGAPKGTARGLRTPLPRGPVATLSEPSGPIWTIDCPSSLSLHLMAQLEAPVSKPGLLVYPRRFLVPVDLFLWPPLRSAGWLGAPLPPD